MKRRDLGAVLFTKYSIPIRVRDLHRAAQPDTWGPGADDARYYLNDELVNYWFKMLNTKLDERAFAGTREKNVYLLSSYFLSKLQENMQQCPTTARNGWVLQLAARIKNKARTSLVS
jgi:Ulp1 family protease